MAISMLVNFIKIHVDPGGQNSVGPLSTQAKGIALFPKYTLAATQLMATQARFLSPP